MSFLSRFFSSSKDQNLPSLAELLAARDVPPDLPGLDEELQRSFASVNASEREAFADAIASLHRQGLSLPPHWSEAQYELLPQIVPSWVGQRDPFCYRPSFDNLCMRLLVTGNPVPQEWLTIWGISEDEALELATEHLEERTKDKPFVRLPSGIYRSDYGDGLDASRIILPHYWNNLFPGQNTFIAIPRPGLLLVAPQVLLPKLVEAIGAVLQESGPDNLVVTMYQWVDSKLMPASLQEPHPMIQPQREFRQMDSLAAYNAQAIELAKMKIGEPCQIAMLRTQQGRTLTAATWVEGKTVLVPDSDLIGFMSSKGKPLGLYWRQTLPRLQRLKGEVIDIWGPRRLGFSAFPNTAELEELECFANAETHAQVLGAKAPQQGRPTTKPNPKSQQSHAASALASNDSPVPAHLRGLSLGVQSSDD
jgi:hypothetical protein